MNGLLVVYAEDDYAEFVVQFLLHVVAELVVDDQIVGKKLVEIEFYFMQTVCYGKPFGMRDQGAAESLALMFRPYGHIDDEKMILLFGGLDEP